MDTNSQSSDFIFFSKQEIEEKNHIYEISSLIEKYGILEGSNELIGPKDKNHLSIINFALNLQKEAKELPEDLKNLFLKNITLKYDINLYLEKKLSNLITDDSNYILKDINVLTFIISIGSNENILNSYYEYDLEAISRLFRFYESTLQDLFKNNEKLFNLTFDTYIILLKTLFQLSIISSINILRNKSIHDIMEVLTESVNIIKYNILLNNTQLSRINNLLGRYLYIFTHLEKIEIDKDDLNNTFIEFLSYLNRQDDGFTLAFNNNFGFEKEFDENFEFLLFKSYSAIYILKLLKKLENIDSILYINNPFFRKIISIFYKRFSISEDILIPKSIKVIKNDLLNSLVFNYNSNLPFDKKQNYKYVLEDFILNDKNIDIRNIETIYRILYFSNEIEEFNYSHIALFLTDTLSIKNGYQEFFKLAILDLYISKVKDKNILTEDDFILLEKIANYSIQNNADFHLHPILTKIYLNIASIFAKNHIKDEKIEELYSICLFINKYSLIEENYCSQNLNIIKYLHVLPDEIETKFIQKFFHKHLIKLDTLTDNFLAKNLSKEQNINFIKDIINRQVFFYIVNIEFINDINPFTNKYELENFILKIDSKNSAVFLFIKLNEIRFNRIFKFAKIFIQDKLDKLFVETKKSSANYYLDDDDLIF
ncbi:hypothetical protein [Arcobacter vandammei]|uniref:hypothetical protein n=1 Tax=Arcobacter vandammei TaxID=2782243 RepID=UPI0018DFA386|nr:hypothetical protein [Arcobacter vandammei]